MLQLTFLWMTWGHVEEFLQDRCLGGGLLEIGHLYFQLDFVLVVVLIYIPTSNKVETVSLHHCLFLYMIFLCIAWRGHKIKSKPAPEMFCYFSLIVSRTVYLLFRRFDESKLLNFGQSTQPKRESKLEVVYPAHSFLFPPSFIL